MKFSCEKETLLNLLNIASRAVTGKSSMPLLEGLLLAADADTLTITGKVDEVNEVFGEITIKATITNQDGKKVTRGVIKAGVAK